MSFLTREQQNFADQLGSVLRRYEREGGDIAELAKRLGQEKRDLKRWADGTVMPAHLFRALVDELPLHLANHMFAGTRRHVSDLDGEERIAEMREALQKACGVIEHLQALLGEAGA